MILLVDYYIDYTWNHIIILFFFYLFTSAKLPSSQLNFLDCVAGQRCRINVFWFNEMNVQEITWAISLQCVQLNKLYGIMHFYLICIYNSV